MTTSDKSPTGASDKPRLTVPGDDDEPPLSPPQETRAVTSEIMKKVAANL
jgi:hypothetical protein